MTKAELQKFIEYVKTHAQSHTFEYFDHIKQRNRQTLSWNMDDLIRVMEKYPVAEEAEPSTVPSICDQLFELYEKYKNAGFDDAQAFDLTKTYYEYYLQG